MIKTVLLVILIYLAVRLVQSMSKTRKEHGPHPPKTRRAAHEVLGVAPDASQDEIRAAYQRLVQQYHPDRVAGMGQELRETAERRTKEINAAYAELKRH